MGRNTLFAFVLLLLFLLGLGGVYIYNFANLNLAQAPVAQAVVKMNSTKEKAVQYGWVSKLANLGKEEFVLPVNQIYIEYKRPNFDKKAKTAYQLFIDKNDIYSMFCLTQTLRKSSVDFTIVKDGIKSQIFLNTQDSELLQKIILELRDYDIHSSVTEVRI